MGMPTEQHQERENEPEEDGVWFFRGQKDVSFAFHSTLYRRLLSAAKKGFSPKTPKDHEKAMITAELALLSKAEENGIGRGLTALETLTLLQHHGSPTRLIDVTSDWKVALFFSCENEDSKDGRVFLLKVSPQRWEDFPRQKNNENGLKKLVWQKYADDFPNGSGMAENYSWLSGVWPILLPFTDPRMIAQRGFFLAGGVPSLKGKGFLYTSKCRGCSKKLCECDGGDDYGRIEHSLTTAELREVTSLSIRFGADRNKITDLGKVRFGSWTAVGYSIKVPKRFKPELREILRNEGVHEDSIYPPLRETSRLFDYIVSESFGTK